MRGLAGLAIPHLAASAVAATAGLGFVTACYSPSAAPGAPCSATGACPAGQHCDLLASPPTCTPDHSGLPDAGGDADTPPAPACLADADCADGVCIEHLGSCVPAQNVLYVATSGADSGGCTATAPCATVGYALGLVANNQRTIAIADGTYAGHVGIEPLSANSLTISGPDRDPAGVILDDGLSLGDNTDNVVVEGITIANTEGRAVDNRGTLTLSRVRLTGAATGLFSAGPTTVRILDSRVDQNTGLGIDVSGTTLELVRSQVRANADGGIAIASASSTIESSIIAGNGGALFATFGGIRYQNLGGRPQAFRFNTVADNQTSLGSSAVSCSTPVQLTSSIFVAAASGTSTVLSTACEPTYSLFADPDAAPAGGGNVVGDPAFVGGGDYHIGTSSAARDAADPAATIARDVDDEVRPQGAGRDIGADEIP